MNALVIMAGGSGTRFWPKSTSKKPKQLLSFGAGTQSGKENILINLTLNRFDDLVQPADRWIVTTQSLQTAMKDAVAPSVRVLAEPAGRNTAPCVYWAAQEIAKINPKAVMMVMPADHFMSRVSDFKKTLKEAAEWARTHDDLVTLGVAPDRPETGYGYLRTGLQLGGACRKVEAFVEKPNLDNAKKFVKEGNYLWNGGMFLWRAEVILKAFDEHMPEMKKAWQSSGGDVTRAYPQMTATSIDYGVMEKAKNVVTFPLDCGWDDIGSWTSLENLADVLQARHEAGTVTGGEVMAIESKGNIVDMPGHVVALLGVNNLIVVEHGDTIMIAHKDRAQDIKLLVEKAKKEHPGIV